MVFRRTVSALPGASSGLMRRCPMGRAASAVGRQGLRVYRHVTGDSRCSSALQVEAAQLTSCSFLFFLSCEQELQRVCVLLHCQQDSHVLQLNL